MDKNRKEPIEDLNSNEFQLNFSRIFGFLKIHISSTTSFYKMIKLKLKT